MTSPYSGSRTPGTPTSQVDARLDALEAGLLALQYLSGISSLEVTQIANINASVFSSARWTFLAGLAIDDYYTEDEADTLLAGKSDTTHDHDSAYSALGHNHDSSYAALSHNHSGVYATESHNHDSSYAVLSHTHDDRYYTESEVNSLISGFTNSAVTITADRTITDTDGVNIIFINPASRAITITLPTLADNLGRMIRFKVIAAGGAVTIDGEGSETIDGATTFIMQSSGDHCTIIGQSTGWRILSARSRFDTGGIECSDWTDRHLGCVNVAYNAGSGSYIVGETVTESTSEYTGIIVADSGTVLKLKNVTGKGVFTSGRTLTGGTSSCARTIAANTIDTDSYITHNMAANLSRLRVSMYVSLDPTYSDTGASEVSSITTSDYGYNAIQVSTSEIKIQTGAAGIRYISDTGGTTTIASSDYSYRIIVELRI